MGHTRTDRSDHRTDSSMHSSAMSADLDLQRMSVFLGKWHMEGRQLAGPAGPAASINAIQTYEWMQGERFLVHRFDGHVDDAPASCIEIIGADPDRRCYRAHTFYNNGQMNVLDIDERGDHWRLLGDWSAGGRSMKVRCTISFADDDRTMLSKWEHSSDGSQWQVFWDVSAHKITDH